eukprot:gnl/MRDRNA2_/MRDRNA2_110445_c0_seq1.p1 gnl/MRDRNA2_/MRDRNA2_110445_c0~~gnl/MRDRNA2_/MRDRNA2_110445_c0_seq1.p1  ORF type:complete len:385 (-),score=67.80 gnl/MRDRNA2_/MRDRNA2_110445_c0_seq1:394-1548(-)
MAWRQGASRLANRLKNLAAGGVALSVGLIAEQQIVAVLKGEHTNPLIARKSEQTHQSLSSIGILRQSMHFEALMQQPLRNLLTVSHSAGEEEMPSCVWTDGFSEKGDNFGVPNSAAPIVTPSGEEIRWLRQQDVFWALSFSIKEEKSKAQQAFIAQMRSCAEHDAMQPVPNAVIDHLTKVDFPQIGTQVNEQADIIRTESDIHYYQFTYSSELARDPHTRQEYVSVAIALGGMTFNLEDARWESLQHSVEASTKMIEMWHSNVKSDLSTEALKEGSKTTVTVTPEMKAAGKWRMIVHEFNQKAMMEWSEFFHELEHRIRKEQSNVIRRVFASELASGSYQRQYSKTFTRKPCPITRETAKKGEITFEVPIGPNTGSDPCAASVS